MFVIDAEGDEIHVEEEIEYYAQRTFDGIMMDLPGCAYTSAQRAAHYAYVLHPHLREANRAH